MNTTARIIIAVKNDIFTYSVIIVNSVIKYQLITSLRAFLPHLLKLLQLHIFCLRNFLLRTFRLVHQVKL